MKFSMNDSLEKQTLDIEAVLEKVQQFTVETPSWGYGDSGTRFKVFHWPGVASPASAQASPSTFHGTG
jgi:L-rhamnose isomerase